MRRGVLLLTMSLALGLPTSAGAVNDPLVPADECAADHSQAVGHPAFVHQQPQGANPPFSRNNPGESTGAKGSANSQATAHCPNASP